MMDRPLVRHTHPIDPRVDQWMLDRWSSPSQHVVAVVYRDRRVVLARQTLIDREFRSVCACGWRSIPTPTPGPADRCPVGDALAERDGRLKHDGDRIDWLLYRGEHDGTITI